MWKQTTLRSVHYPEAIHDHEAVRHRHHAAIIVAEAWRMNENRQAIRQLNDPDQDPVHTMIGTRAADEANVHIHDQDPDQGRVFKPYIQKKR